MPLLSSNRGRLDDDEKVKAALGRLIASLSGDKKNLWESYNEMAAGVDAIRELEWGDMADTVLVFAGLFAAFLSAFLLFTITQLQPDNTEISKNILLHMSRQLNGSASAAFEEESFEVTSSAAKINILFFMSLALVLVDAFLAMLVKGWLRDFDRDTRFSNVPEEKAKERERRLQGIERWKLGAVVALLPLLIQLALVLFCAGLILLLWDIHRPTSYATLATLLVGLAFYVVATIIAAFDAYAPFASPISRGLARPLLWFRISFARPIHYTRMFLSTLVAQMHDRDQPDQRPVEELPGQDMIEIKTISTPFNYHAPRTRSEMHRAFTEHRRNAQSLQSHLDVSHRLLSVTSKALENLSVFMELFDQQCRFPHIRICDFTPWYDIQNLMHILLLDPLHVDNATMMSLCRISISLCAVGRDDAGQMLKDVANLSSKTLDALKQRTRPSLPLESYYNRLLRMARYGEDWDDSVLATLDHEDTTLAELLWSVDAHQLFTHRSYIWNAQKFLVSMAIYLTKGFSDKPASWSLLNALLLAVRSLGLRQEDKLCMAVSGMEVVNLGLGQSFRGDSFKLVDELSVPSHAIFAFTGQLYQHWDAAGEVEQNLALLAALLLLTTVMYPHQGTRHPLDYIKQQHITLLVSEIWVFRHQTGHLYVFQAMEALISGSHIHFKSSVKQCMTSLRFKFDRLVTEHIQKDSMPTPGNDIPISRNAGNSAAESGEKQSVNELWRILVFANILSLPSPLTPEVLSGMTWISEVSDRAALDRLALYDKNKVEPEPLLLEFFESSESPEVSLQVLKWSLRVLDKKAQSQGDFEGAQVQDLRHWEQERREKLLGSVFNHPMVNTEGWLVMMEEVHPRWERLSEDWKEGIAKCFMNSLRYWEWYGLKQDIMAAQTRKQQETTHPAPSGSNQPRSDADPTQTVLPENDRTQKTSPDSAENAARERNDRLLRSVQVFIPFFNLICTHIEAALFLGFEWNCILQLIDFLKPMVEDKEGCGRVRGMLEEFRDAARRRQHLSHPRSPSDLHVKDFILPPLRAAMHPNHL